MSRHCLELDSEKYLRSTWKVVIKSFDNTINNIVSFFSVADNIEPNKSKVKLMSYKYYIIVFKYFIWFWTFDFDDIK